MSEINVFATTFNLATRAASLTDGELQRWLSPVWKMKDGAKADIVVISIQEMSPLHVSMSGLSVSLVDKLSSRFLDTLNEHSDASTYYHVASESLCSIGLWVFVEETSVPRSKLGKVVLSTTGFGAGGTGNKGAVGARVLLDRGAVEGQSQWESFTFVSTHLAAHDYAIKTRNANYQTMLTSLIFPATSALDVPSRVFETSHCFVLGDLNYRLSDKVKSVERRVAGNENDQQKNAHRWDAIVEGSLSSDGSRNAELFEQRKSLVDMDTLAEQRSRNKTMLGLREGPLTSFAPTYKRLMDKVEGYHPKRRPGYTDRILFASHDDRLSGQSNDREDDDDRASLIGKQVVGRTRALIYNSIPEMTISDHKPVYSIINLPPPLSDRSTPSMGSTPYQTPQLPFPYSVQRASDPVVLAIYNGVGRTTDKVIGYGWYTTLILGGGKEVVGLAVEAVLLTVLLFWWKGLWPF